MRGWSVADADLENDPDELSAAGRHARQDSRDPGWYALGTNPNEQSYWDGSSWSGVRHWIAGSGWVDGAGDPLVGAPAADSLAVGGAPRTSGNPYVPPPALQRRSERPPTPATFSLAVLLLMVSGIALMYGSVGTWIHVQGTLGIADFHVSINGIDQGVTTLIGVNGWATFTGGVVLLVFGGLVMSNEETLLAVLTTVVSLAVLIFAIYDMFRIVQKISQLPASVNPSVSVGWGLICVLSAAVLAMIVSLARLFGQR